MPDANTPADAGTGEEPSVADVMDALADVFDDPSEDTRESDPAPKADEPDEDEADGEDNSDPDEAEDEDGESEDPDADEGDEGEDKPGDYDGGRFAAYNAKVKLEDGSTVSVRDLIDGQLRQGDYTRKTQEVAEQRKAVEAEVQRVSQLTQQLDEQFARVGWWLEQTQPKMPQVDAAEDPAAFLQYQQQKAQWDQANQYWQGEYQKRRQQVEGHQQQQFETYRKAEDEAFLNIVPALRDPAKRQAFMTEAEKVAAMYKVESAELKGVIDHRQWLMLRDLVAYHRMKAKAPQVKANLEQRPKMLKGRKRANPNLTKQRTQQAQTERLKREGTVDAGVAALLNMDL